MVNREFSDDFIVISANYTVKMALQLISKISTKYFIVSRHSRGEHFHYIFLTKDFRSSRNNWFNGKENADSLTLKDFFDLHEPNGSKEVDTKIQTTEPLMDRELSDILSNLNPDEDIIIKDNGKIVGIAKRLERPAKRGRVKSHLDVLDHHPQHLDVLDHHPQHVDVLDHHP